MSKIVKYRLLLWLAFMPTSLLTQAQLHSPHEFLVWGNVGSNSLDPSMNKGTSKRQLGMGVGLGYIYHFGSQWGVNLGAEMVSYANKLQVINIQDTYITRFGDIQHQFDYKLEKQEEKINTMFVQIPLMLQYQTASDMHRFYVMAGGKIGIPIKKEATLTAIKYTAASSWEYNNAGIPPTQPAGFESFSREKQKTDISLKTAYLLAIELGVKWRLSEKMSLHTAAYIDYGLNNILKEHVGKRLIEYDNNKPTQHIYNSLVDAQYSDKENGTINYFLKKMNPFAIGFKAALAFSIGGDTGYRREQRKSHVRQNYMDTYKRDYEAEKQKAATDAPETIKQRVEEREQKTMKIEYNDLVKDYLNNTKNKTGEYKGK